MSFSCRICHLCIMPCLLFTLNKMWGFRLYETAAQQPAPALIWLCRTWFLKLFLLPKQCCPLTANYQITDGAKWYNIVLENQKIIHLTPFQYNFLEICSPWSCCCLRHTTITFPFNIGVADIFYFDEKKICDL